MPGYGRRMGPTSDQVRGAVERHCQYWNERNQQAWEALFADDVTSTIPSACRPSTARGGAELLGALADPGREWRLVAERIVVCADEAAVLMRNEGNLHGREVVVDSIEVWKVGADGLVRAVRAYFEPDANVQSDYFTPS